MSKFAAKQEGAQMVVVFPRGQLCAADKAKLSKAGVLAVEADTPNAVNVLSLVPGSSATVSADDLFMSAMDAVVRGGEGVKFACELHRRLLTRAAAAEKTP